MRNALLLALGIVIGASTQTALGQPRNIASLNHIAIDVENFDDASKFYRDGMGFPEPFTFRESDGRPTLSYFQINRDS